VDAVRITPQRVAAGWSLGQPVTELTPLVRVELRYEWRLRSIQVAAAVLADVALLNSSYTVRQAGRVRAVAAPWRVRRSSW
jgi:hypothetical protein